MNDSIAILGRQPELGLAELESLYGGDNVISINQKVVQVRIMPCSIDFSRLGGTVKLGKILKILDTRNWEDIIKFLVMVAPDFTEKMPKGKMHLGLSVYGLEVSPKEILAGGLRIKKAIHEKFGRSVHLVPNKNAELNTAQVLHNKLITDSGWELLLILSGDTVIIAQTVFIQDIESYGLRDFGRPRRDMRVGMLPPKLAQIIINLAIGSDEFNAIKPDLSNDICQKPEDDQKMHLQRANKIILDPFCGTGVVMQEAALMGYKFLGSDLEPRMIDNTKQNLMWLTDRYDLDIGPDNLVVGDATSFQWTQPIDFVASEVYLGRPFTSIPGTEILAQTVSDCDIIIKKFLKNIFNQLKPGSRLCLAIPAWQVKPNLFVHLPLIDHLNTMGYNRLSFGHTQNEKLLYYRDDQFVARELLVLIKS
jgi:tRNA (guanine10-N2)-dimethyltransferase